MSAIGSAIKLSEGNATDALFALLKLSNGCTLKLAVGNESRSLNQLIKVDGIEKDVIHRDLTRLMIFAFFQAFGNKSVTDAQIMIFVDEFLQIKYLTVEDFVCFVGMVIKGKFGMAFKNFSLEVLNDYFDTYLSERAEVYDQVRKIQTEKTVVRVMDEKHQLKISENYIPVVGKLIENDPVIIGSLNFKPETK